MSLNFTAPSLDPGFGALNFSVQSVFVGPGGALLGDASTVTWLDDSL